MIKYLSSAQISYFHIQISLNNITFQRYKRITKKFGKKNNKAKKIYFLLMIKYFSSAQISYFHIQISLNNNTFQRYKRKNKKFG